MPSDKVHMLKTYGTDLLLLSAMWVIDLKSYFDIAASLLILITVAIRLVRDLKQHKK